VHDVYMKKKAPAARKKPRFPVTKMRLWREDREMTLEEAGEAVGLSHAQLSRIEQGHQEYKQSLVIKLAKLYDTDTVSLLERDPKDSRAIWGSIAAASDDQLKDIEKYADFVIRSGK
jgi:transcriptional regulator with XRE-family HTH domain